MSNRAKRPIYNKADKKSTLPFIYVRLKRKRGKRIGNKYIRGKIKVQQRGYNAWNHKCWVTLGYFDTEDEACDILEQQAKLIWLIDFMRGSLE